MQTFYAFAVFLAVVDHKQFQSFFSAKSVAYEEKKIKKKSWWEKLMMGRLTPRAPCSALTTISFFLFFPVLFCSFVLFFFGSRGGLCRKGGTARNVSQPRLLWSGHATHPIHSVVWRDQVNVTPERAQVLFQFSLWQSDWRKQRKVWRKNIHKKKCLGSLAACRSWCSFSLIFNQFDADDDDDEATNWSTHE